MLNYKLIRTALESAVAKYEKKYLDYGYVHYLEILQGLKEQLAIVSKKVNIK